MAKQLVRRAFLYDFTAIHEQDPISHFRAKPISWVTMTIVIPPSQASSLLPIPPHLRVQCGGWFVKQHDMRPHRECSRYGDSLLLSTGQLGRIRLLLILQSHRLQQLVGSSLGFLRRDPFT